MLKNIIIEVEPNICKIFEKMNIFNSILLMINNISYINNFFSQDTTKDIIYNCENNYKPSLSSILFYLNKCLWDNCKETKIYEQKLYNNYINYINSFSQKSNKNRPYIYDIRNVEIILNNIYSILDKELSVESKNKDVLNIKDHPILSKYLNDFHKNHKSIITSYFIGHFVLQKFCINCENICKANGFHYFKRYDYSPFYYLAFNINSIDQYYIQRNIMNLKNIYNNNSQNTNNRFNLIDCFDYSFCYNNNIINSLCEKCKKNSYINQFYIFKLPDIMTIVFNNNDNYNFVLNNRVILNQYENKNNDNREYNLISVLCIYYKKFVCYCNNPTNYLWYSYTDGKIERVDKIHINAKPLIAIYQIRNEKTFKKYNKINIEVLDINKILVIFVLTTSESFNLWFNRNTKIKTVIQTISKLINIDTQKIILLNNANKAEDEQLLENIIINNNKILIFNVIIAQN